MISLVNIHFGGLDVSLLFILFVDRLYGKATPPEFTLCTLIQFFVSCCY